jgi:hypothetical protein
MTAGMPDKILTHMRDHTPLARLGVPADVANALCLLSFR